METEKKTFEQEKAETIGCFDDEVNKRFLELKTNFDKHLQEYWEKPEELVKAEAETVRQILKTDKAYIVDTFGVSHRILSYIHDMPVIVDDYSIKVSPVFSVKPSMIQVIRKYLVEIRQNPNKYLVYYDHFKHRSEHFVFTEALIKYLNYLNNSTKPLGKNSEQQEAVSKILRKMFPSEIDTSLDQIKACLNGEPKPGFIEVTYIGTKTKLWKELGCLRAIGISRPIIAEVFSKRCKWKKGGATTPESMGYDNIYSKIEGKHDT